MEELELPDLGPGGDPFTITGEYGDAWRYRARFIFTAEGLKIWALTIAPIGLHPEAPPPQDVKGPGINSRILKVIRFPRLRQSIRERTESHLGRVLELAESAEPEDQPIIDKELGRVLREVESAEPPAIQRRGRPATNDKTNAQLALDVLDHKDQHGYRFELRALWSEREGRPLKVKTVDTRMRRLRDTGWLIGYGKLATSSPRLANWIKDHPASYPRSKQE